MINYKIMNNLIFVLFFVPFFSDARIPVTQSAAMTDEFGTPLFLAISCLILAWAIKAKRQLGDETKNRIIKLEEVTTEQALQSEARKQQRSSENKLNEKYWEFKTNNGTFFLKKESDEEDHL